MSALGQVTCRQRTLVRRRAEFDPGYANFDPGLSLHPPEFYDLGSRFASHRGSDTWANGFVSGRHRIVIEMGVARRRLRL